jgi:hypothetical protein
MICIELKIENKLRKKVAFTVLPFPFPADKAKVINQKRRYERKGWIG